VSGLFEGVGGQSGSVVVQSDTYEMSAGRFAIWPYVFDEIKVAPLFGFGREAMRRTGLTRRLGEDLNDPFPHPHNAYLELVLDCGLFGFVFVMPFFGFLIWRSFGLFREHGDPLCVAAGGLAGGLVLSLLVGAIGGMSSTRRSSFVGMWAAIGVLWRTSVERSRAGALGLPLFGETTEEAIEATPGVCVESAKP